MLSGMDHYDFYVGFAGYGFAGKDTSADFLVDLFGYEKLSFADPLRSMASAINPIVDCGSHGVVRYREAIEQVGYTEAKKQFPEVRLFLQRFGTDAMRMCFAEDIWVELAAKAAGAIPNPVTFADVRFENEARFISDVGFVVKVERPGFEPVNEHASENDLNDWDFDYVLQNDGEVADLYLNIQDMMQELSSRWEGRQTSADVG